MLAAYWWLNNNIQRQRTEQATFCTRLCNRFECGFQKFLDELHSFNDCRLTIRKNFHEKILEQLTETLRMDDDHHHDGEPKNNDKVSSPSKH
ncbi:hypothetical protein DERP_010270 [Dermatophagoides pteronyssinus]|uniref:Uncharacterized protein n=1 Tax=Dermatophagoides pteronyssinus TaxID=6956 RepID=A0ABQ8IYM8_DERPT|nr:hypothetical protein DERP_010270 [Dermatophagoides pteronyssinus]